MGKACGKEIAMLTKIKASASMKTGFLQYIGKRKLRDADDIVGISVSSVVVGVCFLAMGVFFLRGDEAGFFLLLAGLSLFVAGLSSGLMWRGDTYYIQRNEGGEFLLLLDDRNPRNGKPTLRVTIGGLLNPRRGPKLFGCLGLWNVVSLNGLTRSTDMVIEDVHGERRKTTIEQGLELVRRFGTVVRERDESERAYCALRNECDVLGTLCYAVLTSRATGIAPKLIRLGVGMLPDESEEAFERHEAWKKAAPERLKQLMAYLPPKKPKSGSVPSGT
jgi:hypothetical protein